MRAESGIFSSIVSLLNSFSAIKPVGGIEGRAVAVEQRIYDNEREYQISGETEKKASVI